MKKYIIILFFSLFVNFAFSQIKFQQRYTIGNWIDMFASAIQTSDQGYLMTGTGIGIGTFSIDLVKTDTAGTVEWSKEYHSGSWLLPYSDAYSVSKLIQTSDGGYILCGSRESDFFLLKIDVNGNISWAKNYNKADEDNLNSVKQTSDGGYIAVGSTRLSSNDSLDAYILKVDASGNYQWGATWKNNLVNSDDVLYDVEEDPGNGYIAIGYLSEVYNSGNDTTLDVLVLKTDLSGNLTYGKALGEDDDSEVGYSILRDGTDYYITGYTEKNAIGTDAFFLKMDNSATASFTRTYNYGLTDIGNKVIKQTNGNFAIFGTDAFNFNVFMLNVNSSGTFLSGLEYTDNASFAITVDGQETADGGFMIGTMAGNYDYYLIKTNSAGISNCHETSLSLSTVTLSLPLTNCDNAYSIGGSGGSPTVDVDNFTIDTTVVECIEVPCDTPTVTVNPTSATICDNENQTLTASSPTATTYSWSTGQGGSSIIVSPNNTTTYTVTAYKGICPSHPANVTITVNASPNLSISGDTTICEGKYTTLTASGANNYSWSTGANTAIVTVFPTTDSVFTVIGYNTNCSDTLSQLVTVGQNPNIAITGDTIICFGETTTLTASSNNGGNDFNWSSGDNSASTTVSPLSTTTYWVTVTNSTTTCFDSAEVNVNVNQLPIITFTGDTSLCIGDSTIITASGGNTYSWNTGSSYDTINVSPSANTQYIVSVTDTATTCINSDTINVYVHPLPTAIAFGDTTICENLPAPLNATGGVNYIWSPSGSLSDANIANPTATPSTTTTYYVTVTSIYQCSDIDSVTVNINQAPQFTLSSDSTNCYNDANGSANINISQSQNYTYLWNTGDTTLSLSNLPAGSYSITVTDTIGCFAIDSINVYQPYLLTDSAIVSNISCYGDTNGQIMLSVNGGTTPYTYSWSNSQTTQNISNLSAGYYNVTITDKNGCSTITSNIPITEPDEINLSTYSTDILCYNDTNATININANGGTGDFTYYVNNLPVSYQVNNVGAGTYTIEVRDSNNCPQYDTIIISQPANISVTDSIYYQNFGGNIVVNVTGGTGTYNYLWSTGEKQNQINNLSSGTYTITVTDANDCEFTADYNIDIPLQIPSAITPNADGYNDTWNIINIEAYKQIKIQIFNRWGNEVFTFEGSGYDYKTTSNQWDGTYKGKLLPVAGYLYIVNLGNGIIKSGPVTLIR